jgi:hypothetical protein
LSSEGFLKIMAIRNGPYLDEAWFAFLAEAKAAPVFSEKLYLPPVAELCARHAVLLSNRVVVRLLGGDRKAIDDASGER